MKGTLQPPLSWDISENVTSSVRQAAENDDSHARGARFVLASAIETVVSTAAVLAAMTPGTNMGYRLAGQ